MRTSWHSFPISPRCAAPRPHRSHHLRLTPPCEVMQNEGGSCTMSSADAPFATALTGSSLDGHRSRRISPIDWIRCLPRPPISGIRPASHHRTMKTGFSPSSAGTPGQPCIPKRCCATRTFETLSPTSPRFEHRAARFTHSRQRWCNCAAPCRVAYRKVCIPSRYRRYPTIATFAATITSPVTDTS